MINPNEQLHGISVLGESGRPDTTAPANVRVLIVDNDGALRENCASLLRVDGYAVSSCASFPEAHARLQHESFDVVLLDLRLNKRSALELLGPCLAMNSNCLVIIMTGDPSVNSAVEALQAGAWQYLPKPFAANHLKLLVGRAAHSAALLRNLGMHEPDQQIPAPNTVRSGLLGVSPAFRSVVRLAHKVAFTDASVLLFGESGTGKEQIAQYIHKHSRRKDEPMLAVNCAALPEPLLESEMFGHVRGAFTDALRDKQGILEAANGGTLFLDELTEMPRSIQAKLLRVVQDGVVRRVGSNQVDAHVNVRFIAATNQDPAKAAESGTLRKDLYYRLRVVPIRIPPLRERREDIPILAEHFLGEYWLRHRGTDLERPWFGPAALAALRERTWPGNVRELQNVIEHAVVLLQAGSEVLPEHLPCLTKPDSRLSFPVISDNEPYHAARDRVVAEFERSYLQWLVTRAQGNISQAARIAGVDRTTLYRWIGKHDLQREIVIRSR